MNKIRTLVVDDEPMARERILGLLAQETVLLRAGTAAMPDGSGPNMNAPAGTIISYRALLAASWTNQAP